MPPPLPAPDPSCVLASEFVGDDPPTPSCHAATIEDTPAGPVAAWFGGTREGANDVGIWVSRHRDGRWTAPVQVADGTASPTVRWPTWNPVLFQPRTGPLMLFYKVGPHPSLWWGELKTSADGGTTWSPPRPLPEGILGPVKNRPLELHGGDLLCPSSAEDGPSRVHFERTSDLGETWTATPPVESRHGVRAIQPSLLVHPGRRLQAVGRTDCGQLFETWSEDDGRTWSPLAQLAVPNPNSGADAATLAGGRHVLVCNPVTRGRSPLVVAVSADGRTWTHALDLETERGAEFSYPSVVQARDGRLHVVYTWKRRRIRHVVLDPAALELAAAHGWTWHG